MMLWCASFFCVYRHTDAYSKPVCIGSQLWLGPLFCSLLVTVLYSTESQVLNFARALQQEGDFYAAQTEYERYLFFNPTAKNSAEIHHEAACCYFRDGRMVEALAHLDSCLWKETNLCAKNEYRLTAAATLLALNRTVEARSICAQFSDETLAPFSHDSLFQNHRTKARFLNALSYLFDTQSESPLDSFRYFLATIDTMELKRFAPLLRAASSQDKVKSDRMARLLSCALPGAGQLYGGLWRDGLNAVAVNSLFGWLFVSALCSQQWTDAFLFGPILVGIYRSNIHNGEMAAVTYNKKQKQKALKRYRTILESISTDNDDF